MQVSILIPTHFRASAVETLLQSIANQEFDLSQVEVLVVSNISDLAIDALSEKSWPFTLRLFTAHTVGVNIARNIALKNAQGRILYYLDDDCILPSSQHLNYLMKAHSKHETAVGVGGYYLSPKTATACDRAYNLIQMSWQERTGSFIGGNSSYKRSLLPSDLFFNEKIVFGGAENSFNETLRALSQQLHLTPEISVIHETHISVWQLMKKAQAQSKNKSKFRGGEGLTRIDKIWTTSPLKFFDLKILFYTEIYREAFDHDRRSRGLLLLQTACGFWCKMIPAYWRDRYLDLLVSLSAKYLKK